MSALLEGSQPMDEVFNGMACDQKILFIIITITNILGSYWALSPPRFTQHLAHRQAICETFLSRFYSRFVVLCLSVKSGRKSLNPNGCLIITIAQSVTKLMRTVWKGKEKQNFHLMF